ncbi:ubiquitin family protein [Granulicella tundricola]|uniref:ThiamineS protein n=1 Tax=Granulicella tundricola (strain ATCC BAA-1859 / DSM 23138 / MP5ACTX9) TaxID=1198114 RepID=E8X2Z3_GRATM|nr:hypothetical protein [Granulicella tundricola]ADW68127.1 hypothetical protein AciX9_1064 [Granulicella tundricola MP5ACTX9]
MIRVELPAPLCRLAGCEREVTLEVRVATLGGVMDALEEQYPALRGAVRDYATGERRAYLRFFAGEEDISAMRSDEALPDAVARGDEALLVIGAIAGGL